MIKFFIKKVKKEKEIYSISSLLIHLLIFVGLLTFLGTDENGKPINNNVSYKNLEFKTSLNVLLFKGKP